MPETCTCHSVEQLIDHALRGVTPHTEPTLDTPPAVALNDDQTLTGMILEHLNTPTIKEHN
ncbi:hypothetical protein [Arthrobacter sp. HLT1-21]